jgi:hypothetical protein
MERPEEAGLFVTENCQYDIRLKRRGNREGRSEREESLLPMVSYPSLYEHRKTSPSR